MIGQALGGFQVADVFHAAGGEIVEQDYGVAALKKAFSQMGSDETGAAGDQKAQCSSSEFLIVVVVVNGDFATGFKAFIGRRGFRLLLRAVALGIRIIPIRIVIVRGAGIYRVQNDTEKVALYAEEQIARARKSFLRRFAAAHDKENTIRFDGKDDGVGGSHDGRRIDDDKFELGAKLRDGLGQLVGGKQIGGIGRERAGGNGGEIWDGRMLNGDEIETGNSGQVGAEAGVFSAGET